jgi:hypothetical protein
MRSDHQKVRRPTVTVIEVLVGIVWLFIMGIRVTSIVMLGVLAALYVAYPLYRRPSLLIVGLVAYFGSLLLPVDVVLGDFMGRHYGSTHSGPRFIHCAGPCLTAHSYLRRTYGEYATHMSAGGPFGPRWVFVWD